MTPSDRADLRDTIIASIAGYLIGLIISMPPGTALLFMGCTPTTLKHILGEYHWKEHHILTNIAAFIFCNAINMTCAYGMLISLALLVICLLLIPFGIDFDTSVYHLFRYK